MSFRPNDFNLQIWLGSVLRKIFVGWWLDPLKSFYVRQTVKAKRWLFALERAKETFHHHNTDMPQLVAKELKKVAEPVITAEKRMVNEFAKTIEARIQAEREAMARAGIDYDRFKDDPKYRALCEKVTEVRTISEKV